MLSDHSTSHVSTEDDAESGTTGLASKVDKHIGDRIRTFRQDRGVTQQELARALGISYQQVQKYENGANRVSAGRLYVIATALGVEVASFYDALSSQGRERRIAITSEETVAAARELSSLRSPRVRSSIRALVRSLAAESGFNR